jgi:hypothetical protein
MGKNNLKNASNNLKNPLSSPPSIPGVPNAPQPPISGGAMIDPLSSMLYTLNTNPYLIGVFMILLNLGGRFLPLELTKNQESFLQSPFVRPLILFTVIFIATRNLAVAFWLTLAIFALLWFLANEKSEWCIIPGWKEINNDEKEKAYQENMKILSQTISK